MIDADGNVDYDDYKYVLKRIKCNGENLTSKNHRSRIVCMHKSDDPLDPLDLEDCIVEKLHLGRCGLTKIPKAVNKLTIPKELILSRNKIRKIENLDALWTLRSLNLVDNKITKIEGLDNLENLRVLDVRYNKINESECKAFEKDSSITSITC